MNEEFYIKMQPRMYLIKLYRRNNFLAYVSRDQIFGFRYYEWKGCGHDGHDVVGGPQTTQELSYSARDRTKWNDIIKDASDYNGRCAQVYYD